MPNELKRGILCLDEKKIGLITNWGVEEMKNREDLIHNLKDYYEKSLTVFRYFGGPCVYFHTQCIQEQKEHFLSYRHIELIYATLTAWGMHRMGDPRKTRAKLVEFHDFKSSILQNGRLFESLRHHRLESMSLDEYAHILERLRLSYHMLKVSISEASIVANSKTLAHILPDLIPPIDRQYTVRFFTQEYRDFFGKNGKYRQINLPGDRNKQFARFRELCYAMKTLLDQCDLNMFELSEDTFNTSYPKIIDNLIVAYVKSVPKPS